MIKPVQNNIISTNLRPVEVPHFTGFTKVAATSSDEFLRSNKKISSDGISDAKTKAREMALNAKVFFTNSGKKIKKGAKVASEFTCEFVKAFTKDTLDVMENKLAKVLNYAENTI